MDAADDGHANGMGGGFALDRQAAFFGGLANTGV